MNHDTHHDLGHAIDAITAHRVLDGPAELVARLGRGTPRRLAGRLHAALGHPSHPPITDLPIGFWTSAWVLDLLPGRASTDGAARTLLGLGVLSTVPTIVTGLGDAAGLEHQSRRTAALHGILNAAATGAFAYSWWLRRHRTTARARAVVQIGAVLATAAGALGGHLALTPAPTKPS